MFNLFFKYFIFLLVFIIICFMGITFSLSTTDGLSFSNNILDSDFISSSGFVWPTPGYDYITSPFGYRVAPTSGAGTFHGGIDIGAPAGSTIVSAFPGTVTYIGFYGANGYTVRISDGYYTANYSHVSPYFLVYEGQYINKGEIIGTVGPKNVYGVPNNPYKDSNGNPTNGATTGPHLHFSIRIDGKAVNPMSYY